MLLLRGLRPNPTDYHRVNKTDFTEASTRPKTERRGLNKALLNKLENIRKGRPQTVRKKHFPPLI